MPPARNPVPDLSEKKATGIYIARGPDTLGPYNPAEAAALVIGGYLQRDDYAARNGDAAWVPLAEFLPPAAREEQALPAPSPAAKGPETHAPRGRRLLVAFVALASLPLLIAGGMRWFEARRAVRPTSARPTPRVVPETTPAATPVPTVLNPPAATPTPPPPSTPEPDGPLRGSLAVPQAGVQIAVYPLDSLETALAPAVAAAQAAREHLDPLVAAATAEHAAREAEEKAALQALNDAAPTDPLRPSLRFAYNGAKTATRTAADNERFLLDERAAAAGGEMYFRALPAPVLTVETDAAGGFTLDLPPDGPPYAVAASVRQTADDGSPRTRRWLVRPSAAQRTGHAPLRLDDDNSLNSASEDSVVHTAD